jgi:hypothetical protein
MELDERLLMDIQVQTSACPFSLFPACPSFGTGSPILLAARNLISLVWYFALAHFSCIPFSSLFNPKFTTTQNYLQPFLNI